ncbi:hypothetical protein [Pseudomonas moorei]|uniref:hypothetical protein n=1 Tax=Pseudomonas moorei TaxID=395599 RepID=UPI0036F375BF
MPLNIHLTAIEYYKIVWSFWESYLIMDATNCQAVTAMAERASYYVIVTKLEVPTTGLWLESL